MRVIQSQHSTFQGTAVRQRHLLVGKYFRCSCRRCRDPTELGTYMSSLKCAQCKLGVVCETDAEQWRCVGCEKEYEPSDVQSKVQCCADKLRVISEYLCVNSPTLKKEIRLNM